MPPSPDTSQAANPRYLRQIRLPQVGARGQLRLRGSHVLIVGVGALGTVAADLLCRAGVGKMTLIDRDVVDVTNLQRQTLYTADNLGQAKVAAAAERLARVNPDVAVVPLPIDATADDLLNLLPAADLALDATDNAHTRYLLNEACVERQRPWVYGGAVASQGLAAAFAPVRGGGCLRCLFPQPPHPGELPTCDTVGVFGPLTSAVASLQAQLALRLLLDPQWIPDQLLRLDLWQFRLGSASLPEAGCPTCRGGFREFLHAPPPPTVQLCGRCTVQIRPPRPARPDLARVAQRWTGLGRLHQSPYLLRLTHPTPEAPPGIVQATLFTDGRLLLEGPIAESPGDSVSSGQLRAVYDRLVGS